MPSSTLGPIDARLLRDLGEFGLLGLGPGAVYATLALGLVLVHRVTGVVNFAHGAMAMMAVYAFVELVGPLGHSGALAVAVALAAVLGLTVYGAVFARLQGRPALAGVVASVGVMTTLQAVASLAFGSDSRPVPSLLPAGTIGSGAASIPLDRLLLGAFAATVALALWAVFRFTRFGLASRATAEDPTALVLLGWSPTTLAAVTWVVAGILGGLSGVLAGPVTALDPVSSTLLVVPALAAAVVGGMSSFGITTAAALALGVTQSMVLVAQDRWEWLPRAGLREALPLIVIVVALAAGGGKRLFTVRSPGPASRRLPLAPASRHLPVLAATGLALGTAAVVLSGDLARLALVTSLIGAVLCLSLVILTGYVGQISLAQMAFAGLAGFGLVKLGAGLSIPFPVAPLLAALLASIAGVVVGLPALRVRGTSLAIATLASAVAIEDLVFKNAALTGGFGGTKVPELGLGPPSSLAFGLFVLGVLAAVGIGVALLRDSPTGRRFLAVRTDEAAAGANGVDVVATKLAAFALSAFVAGLGGTLLAYSQAQLSFGSFGVFVSLSLLAVAYVGGIGRVSGAVAGGMLVGGGLLFSTLDRMAGLGRYQLLVSGLALVVIVLVRPDGLVGRMRKAA